MSDHIRHRLRLTNRALRLVHTLIEVPPKGASVDDYASLGKVCQALSEASSLVPDPTAPDPSDPDADRPYVEVMARIEKAARREIDRWNATGHPDRADRTESVRRYRIAVLEDGDPSEDPPVIGYGDAERDLVLSDDRFKDLSDAWNRVKGELILNQQGREIVLEFQRQLGEHERVVEFDGVLHVVKDEPAARELLRKLRREKEKGGADEDAPESDAEKAA